MAQTGSIATNPPRVAVLIVAAGRGVRAGRGLPKQYRRIGGTSVLARAVAPFLDHCAVAEVRVAIHPDDRALYDRATAGLVLAEPVAGGATRQESVKNGLEAWVSSALSPDIVLIHDAARCFVTAEVIDRVIAAVDETAGAIPALAVADTLKRGDEGRVVETVPREGLWRAQTPQGFPFRAILEAHRAAADTEMTDDAAVAEAAGLPVRIVEGAESNRKLTHAADFAHGERGNAPALEPRVGSGFDVHRFTDGGHVWLCGIKIPHSHGLSGHSDADAGLHALTDALLGAIAAGDIGKHFPPSDPQWKDAASDRFLAHAAALLAAAGGRVAHCDITLICERPKLAPHIAAMRGRIAEILEIDAARVSVKATTTEKLGFTGRGEGLAAQATATVMLPGEG